jgi:N,N'-diacetyllegionaminate synthase
MTHNKITDYSKPYLIGETAFHHQGDFEFLNKLVDAGVAAGVDTLKFHLLFELGDYFVQDHSAFQALIDLSIKMEDWTILHTKLQGMGIKPIYLCNDVAAMKWVNSLPSESVSAVEIHATGLNDIFLLKESLNFGNSVLIGTGGSTLDEISYAIDFLRKNGKSDIILMHGFQNYPTDYKDINLGRMKLLKDMFNLPVGYADHTDPANKYNEYISTLPVASGFTIVEKHFTITDEKRIDGQAAISIEQLKNVRELMDINFLAHGNDPMEMSEAEKKYGDTGPMKKAIVARRPIAKGNVIEIDDIAFKRTNGSVELKQNDLSKLLGNKAIVDIDTDTPISFRHIEYAFKVPGNDQFFINKK